MRFCGGLLFLLLLVSPVLTVEGQPQNSPVGSIEVSSRQMEVDQAKGTVLFLGSVVGKRGEMTIYADKLTLYLVDIDGKRNIERLTAAGQVRVVDGERVARANNLEYLQAEEKMILTGKAEVHQAANLVSGEEIILFIREDRSLVKSGKDGRVKAVFLPEQERK